MLSFFRRGGDKSGKSDKELFKETLIDIRLLQLTCQNFEFPGARPEKYMDITTIEEAHTMQRGLTVTMKVLAARLSKEDRTEVIASVDPTVREIMAIQTAGAEAIVDLIRPKR